MAQAQAVRSSAPQTPILASINAIETTNGAPSVPDNYYLKDVNGNKIQTWPGSPGNFLLNMTNPTVVQFLAQYAYQQMTPNGFTYDGMFFDNVEFVISTTTTDCCGNPVQIDANGDGIPDNPATLDAAWSAGVYALIAAFHQLAPNSYISGHINQLPPDPRTLAAFNGDALGFDAVNVREGKAAFGDLWDTYQQWFTQGQSPVITVVQSSPPNQIAYGYGYAPLQAAQPSTVTFGQTFYPNMRFGLGLALMNNGYFVHDFGDSSSPVTWWYDEYGFNLGSPVTPAATVGTIQQYPNEIVNGGFESSLSPWLFAVTNDGQASASISLDPASAFDGKTSAHVNVASAGTVDYHVNLEQGNLALTSGVEYRVQFWARADSPLTFGVSTQGGAPSYASYGLNAKVAVSTSWALYTVSFIAPVSAQDCRLEFRLGSMPGNIWLDDVQMVQAALRIYRRDFTNGVVLLNGTNSPQTITLDSGLQRFSGSQAPRYQYIVDDTAPGFTTSGTWLVDTFDTGFRTASGPYYHAWNKTLHELDASSGSAQWNLAIPSDGKYTIQVWLPAAPSSSTWTPSATYQITAGSQVIATATLNQSSAAIGDQWFTLFSNLNLTAATAPVLSVQNGGSGPLIADAVYVFSSALYNDGSAASQITLAPMDAILLQRQTPNQ
ncbi:MAG: carbohydrate binding domain-containing protein, partial [Acidobacteriota bacterium]|nr:carbohydrate binding domain-containing protein [Acidobacteriota bacterium]